MKEIKMRKPPGTKNKNFQVSYDFSRLAYPVFRKGLRKIDPRLLEDFTITQSVIAKDDKEIASRIFDLIVKCKPNKASFDDCLTIYRYNHEDLKHMKMPSSFINPFKVNYDYQVNYDYLPEIYLNGEIDKERHRQRARFNYRLTKLLGGNVTDHSKTKSVLVVPTFKKAKEIAQYIVEAGGLRVSFDVCKIISRFP